MHALAPINDDRPGVDQCVGEQLHPARLRLARSFSFLVLPALSVAPPLWVGASLALAPGQSPRATAPWKPKATER